MSLPNDPFILLSVLNTRLRDFYPSLEECCKAEDIDQDTVINQLDRLKDGSLAIIIDCGADDFFLQVNKAAHEALLKRGIGHDFIIRPGAHNPRYWNNAIDYQVLFFKKFFNKSK